tara:strand:+ start:22881 stop:24350 length:1470 start_codon:yes stop_codon:yes gene_type:complete
LSQYQYRLKTNSLDQPKIELERVSKLIDFYKRSLDTNYFVISSRSHYSEEFFHQLFDSLNLDMVDYEVDTRNVEVDNSLVNQKACCDITLDMDDSFGDGWNGGYLTVSIDGTSNNYNASGFGSIVTIPYCDGEIVSINYTSGSWESENSFTITSPAGTLVSEGSNPSTGNLFYSDNACSSTNESPKPQDCEGAHLVCSNNTFNGDAVDFGDNYEIDYPNNTECDMNSENQSTWFYVNIGSSGTLEMTIDPTNGTDDYDWAIWGPYTSTTAAANCSPIEPPLRCNTSANIPQTGMNTSATNNYEYPGTSTFEWSNPINANAGDIYIMMIDNWSASGSPFTLDWGGTAGLSCTSVVLPITLMDFNGVNMNERNKLYWSTGSEKNNSHFIVEYSPDGNNWEFVDMISGAGTSTTEQHYSTDHRDFENGINYYRLLQFDFDGETTKHKVISIDNGRSKQLLKRVNLLGQEVNDSYRGIVLLYYSDGTTRKVLQ